MPATDVRRRWIYCKRGALRSHPPTGTRMRGNEARRDVARSHKKRCGPCVGSGGRGKDDGGHAARRDGLARSWVHDVGRPIRRTAPRGADGKGFVTKLDDGAAREEGRCMGRRGQGDTPCREAGRAADGDNRAGAAMEQRRGDAAVAQDLGGAVEGPALADGPRVDFNAGPKQLDGTGRGIEPDVVPSNA